MVKTSDNLIICSHQEELQMLPEGYEFLLAFSRDTLLVVDKKQEVVIEWIISGKDNDGFVVQAPDQDSFLDAILTIKAAIEHQVHPLNCF